MFSSDDPRKKKLLELLNSHMLEYGKTLHTLANDKERLKEEWDRAEMEKEVFFILLPQKLKAIHDLMVALGVRERKPVEEFTARGVIKIKGKKKTPTGRIPKKRKPKKSKNDTAIDLAIKIMMDKGGMSEEQARKIMGKG
jgi:hypothetical protein